MLSEEEEITNFTLLGRIIFKAEKLAVPYEKMLAWETGKPVQPGLMTYAIMDLLRSEQEINKNTVREAYTHHLEGRPQ